MGAIKVFHIITGGLHREGISSTQVEFFKHMDLNAFEIWVAAVLDDEPGMIEEFERNGCHVIPFPNRRKHTVKYFLSLIQEMRTLKPNIVHVHGSSAILSIELLAAKIAGVKIRIAHSRNTKADQVKADRMLRPLFHHLYTDALACGEDAGKWLFGEKGFTIVHNGKDFKKFRFDSELREKQRQLYGLEDKIVVGHVGVFNSQKNHEYLIKVFDAFQKAHPESILYLMGSGKLVPEVKQQIEQLGLSDKVFLAGSVNNVAERLQAMDIMVFPSRFEGLPNVVLEWQAEGLPCLISDKITDECAPSDLVRFASIEDSPKIWADKMEQILADFTDRQAQAVRGSEALKKNGFDIEDAAKKLEDIYCHLGNL